MGFNSGFKGLITGKVLESLRHMSICRLATFAKQETSSSKFWPLDSCRPSFCVTANF